MDVPSKRERLFFIANRMGYRPLQLDFKLPIIKFGKVRSVEGVPCKNDSKIKRLLRFRKESDHCLGDINKRLHGRNICFNDSIVSDDRVCPTITSSGTFSRLCDGHKFSAYDFIVCQSFPQDYDFCGRSVQYICGMSVPPNMMAHIADEIYNQWLKKE